MGDERVERPEKREGERWARERGRTEREDRERQKERDRERERERERERAHRLITRCTAQADRQDMHTQNNMILP